MTIEWLMKFSKRLQYEFVLLWTHRVEVQRVQKLTLQEIKEGKDFEMTSYIF